MSAHVHRQDDLVTVTFTLKLSASMLQTEEELQHALNQAGAAAMEQVLTRFDADGSPIRIGDLRLTSKGRSGQTYETPHGPVRVLRHVYQSSKGGRTFCPLEDRARMVMNATPRYAKIIAGKYTRMGAEALRDDLREGHAREISRRYVKQIGDFVGAVATAKEAHWRYEIPELPRPVAAVSVGLDGTCMLMKPEGWRQAMCGSISLYDRDGERMHTLYAGASPEYGKETFYGRFDAELTRVKEQFPAALYIGLADGAADNWSWLGPRTERQLLDFWHAREYVGKAARAIHGAGTARQEAWEEDWRHRLKHARGAAGKFLREVESGLFSACGLDREDLEATASYFTNNGKRMGYWRHVAEGLPIGSGVTEAACKVLIKERLCGSGMRWKGEGAEAVIALRALKMTDGRWEQFWKHIDRQGVN